MPNTENYQSFTKEAKKYVSSYKGFLMQIPEQAENLKKTGNYQDNNTYLCKNFESV